MTTDMRGTVCFNLIAAARADAGIRFRRNEVYLIGSSAMKIKRLIPVVLFLGLSLPGLSVCKDHGGGSDAPFHSFEFAPEYHYDETFLEFFNPKNDFFKNRYFLENSLYLDAAFFSFSRRYFFFGNVVLNFDMGRQSGAILLDPNEIDMGFGPIFEYRMDRPRIFLQAGLDHHCFHQIDKTEWNTLYWNKLFISTGSPNMREGDYRKQLKGRDAVELNDRLSWQASYGLFLHEFFGLLDTNAMSWGNAYIHEIFLSGRWAFLRQPNFYAFVTGQSQTRIDRKGTWLWKENLGGEISTLGGDFGLSFFFNWNIVDESIPRENRDKLVEVGVRVFR
jgi:hypothetical protein